MNKSEFHRMIEEWSKESDRKGRKDNTVFLPAGLHSGRLLFDTSEPMLWPPYRRVLCHTFQGGKVFDICPDYLAERDKEHQDQYPVCDYCRIADDPKYQAELKRLAKSVYDSLNRQVKTLAYFYVLSTDNPSERFKVNNLYVIIGSNKLGQGIDAMIKRQNTNENRRDTLYNSLTWNVEGRPVEINYVKAGRDSTVNVQVVGDEMSEALPLKEGDIGSLNEAWIPHRFNKAHYERSVRQLLGLLNVNNPIVEGAFAEGKNTTVAVPEQIQEKSEDDVPDPVPVVNSDRVAPPLEKKKTKKSVNGISMEPPAGVVLPVLCPGFSKFDKDLVDENGDPVCLSCDAFIQCHEAQEQLALEPV